MHSRSRTLHGTPSHRTTPPCLKLSCRLGINGCLGSNRRISLSAELILNHASSPMPTAFDGNFEATLGRAHATILASFCCLQKHCSSLPMCVHLLGCSSAPFGQMLLH
jgi:hypothetical protein